MVIEEKEIQLKETKNLDQNNNEDIYEDIHDIKEFIDNDSTEEIDNLLIENVNYDNDG